MAGALATATRFVRASATNLLARVAPRTWIRLARQTGRGDEAGESPADMADYFVACFDDYWPRIGIAPGEVDAWLRGKTVLEYGPGDVPGVAILMVAHGARNVVCVDRFPLVALSPKNVEAVRCIVDRLDEAQRERALACFRVRGDPTSGFEPARIELRLHPRGLSGLEAQADLVISRAVLEHVNNLEDLFRDMERALRPGCFAVHQVDLKSHGLHRQTPLDFLAWPAWAWDLMFSHKGAPNRWRIDRYREVLAGRTLEVCKLEPTLRASPADVAAVRERLALPFRRLSDEDLSLLGFWLVCRRPAAPALTPAPMPGAGIAEGNGRVQHAGGARQLGTTR